MTKPMLLSTLALALCLAGSSTPACTLHGGNAPRHGIDRAAVGAPRAKAASLPWIGPAASGSWYAPARSGEGIIVQVLDDGSVIAIWFTFPPPGSAAEQAWILAQGGVIQGNRVRFDQAFTTRGPRFGPQFDPAARVLQPWGSLEFNFEDCNNATLSYAGPPEWGAATRKLQRLTSLDELGCQGKQRLTSTGARSLSGLRQRSAAWFDPSHSGEGWFIEELPDGRAISYWFTYDEHGEQAWTVGIAEHAGDRMEVTASVRPVGTHFGEGFATADVRRQAWGSHTLNFSGCDAGTLSYDSLLPAFGSGGLRPQRLTRLAGIACVEGAPRAPTGGTWSMGTPMPVAQSEFATAVRDGQFHIAGGFGSPRGVRRYDPQANRWTTLADLPGGRDHAEALAIGDQLFVTGGFRNDVVGDQDNAGWRYVESGNRWEPVPGLPRYAASGAASLNGYAYFASDTGELTQFDPRTHAARVIPGDASRDLRDHSQLVAFMGELWLMAGRGTGSGETQRVSIFDPASETWRSGPPLRLPRGGFAAAVSATQIIIAGGEVVIRGHLVRGEVEAIAAGESAWSALPGLPVPVHGVGGAVSGNAFYALGGSSAAGLAVNSGQVQIYRWTP